MTRSAPVRALRRLALAAALLAAPASLAGQGHAAGTTTVVVVRHAEKAADDPQDPSLSPAGRERALALRDALADAPVAAVYATQFRRTRATGEPLATRAGQAVVVRPATAANAATYARDLAAEILSRYRGRTVVVVGHSNTVPEIVRALSGKQVAPITDTEYDHLFVVQVPPSGPASLLRARYGPPSAGAGGAGPMM
ncbi:MAG: histidine phosphatase family protein [Gemmatimonadetes bacterium]|nr:histidine phosphatase family protein [Gemmatimonadota bacterium]